MPGFDATQISETFGYGPKISKKRQGLDGTQISETFGGPGDAGQQLGSNGGAIGFGPIGRSEYIEAAKAKAAEGRLAARQGLDATQISETFGYNAAGRTEARDAEAMLGERKFCFIFCGIINAGGRLEHGLTFAVMVAVGALAALVL